MTDAEYARSKRKGRGISNEMTPEAIERRFDIMVELNELCDWLSTAEPVSKVEEAPKSDSN